MKFIEYTKKRGKVYGIIYKIRNKVNNKIYIGQTIKTFDERYKYNLAKNTHNECLKRDIEIYGIDNFEIDKEFSVAYSKRQLDKLEEMYIKIYNLLDDKYGYNKTLNSKTMVKNTDMKKVATESKGVPIICITTGKIFNSLAEGSEYYNFSDSTLGNYLKHGRRCGYCGEFNNIGLQWEYLDKFIKGLDEALSFKVDLTEYYNMFVDKININEREDYLYRTYN